MKKNLFVLGIILLFLTSALGQAAVEITQGLTNGRIELDVNYNTLTNKGNSTISLSSLSLALQNKGNTSENVSLQLTNVNSGYTFGLSDNNFVLTASGTNSSSKTISLTTTVPVNADSGNHTVGALRVGSTNYNIITKVKSMLLIDDVKVYVNDQKEDSINEDGDKISDIRPGNKIELKFRIKNQFDKDYKNGDIEDIELKVKFKDSDDEDDFGTDIDEKEEFELDAGEKDENQVITIKVPTSAKEKDYPIIISVEGKDENNAKHKVEWEIELKVDRKRDDVQLETATVGSSTLDCVRSTTLKAKMTNFGSNTQKDAALTIYSKELNISYSYTDLTLDKDPEDRDNSYEKIIPIYLSDSLKAGTYYIEVRAYIDDTKQTDYKSIKLTVNSCSTSTSSTTTNNSTPTVKNDTSVIVVPATTTTSQTTQPTTSTKYPITQTIETSLTQIKGVVVFMVIIAVLLALLIILAIYLLVKRKE